MRQSRADQIAELWATLRQTVTELESLVPGRRFTLDGHLVGSVGEAIAAERYGLDLLPASTETHDARAPDGRLVQIKATQRASVGLYSQPDHLLVLRLQRDGSAEEVYNGPGHLAWDVAGPEQKNGQHSVSLTKLRKLMVGTV